MFEKISMQYGEKSQNCPKSDKNIIMTFSLLMRLFEWCHEDAKDDIEMHEAMEKIVSFSDGINPLNIDSYEAIIGKGWSDEDAYNLGKQQAENGMDLTPVEPRDYSKTAGNMITAIKNDGFGASNDEIFAFWDGYEGKPLKQGNFTEIDMNNAVDSTGVMLNPFKITDGRSEPTTISFGEETCEQPDDCLDDEMASQVDAIIKAGKF